MILEIDEILSITVRHATKNQVQTIGTLERTDATRKMSLKLYTCEFRKQWHKFSPLTISKYNTTYHTSIGRDPGRIFHGRVPYNLLNYKLGLQLKTGLVKATGFSDKILGKTQILYDKTKKKLMQSYIRSKKYYGKEPKASPLQERDHCYILQRSADRQWSKIPRGDCRWTGPHVVENALPNEKYTGRKSNTNKIQSLQGARLANFTTDTP